MTTAESAEPVAPVAPLAAARPPAAPSPGRTPRRPSRWVWPALAAVTTLALAVLLGTPVADVDTAQDVAGTLLPTAALLGRPDWRLLPVLVALTAAHYVLAAVAMRAGAGPGCRTSVRESILVQLVATVANRVTPTGVGGAAVASRYLARRGLAAPEALGAVAGLTLFGGLADAIAFALLLLLGPVLGLNGFGGELQALGARLQQAAALLTGGPWPIALLAVGLPALCWLVFRFTRGSGRPGRLGDGVARAGRRMAGLVRRPRGLALLLASSAGTTMVLALALAVSVAAVSGSSVAPDLGGLLAAYLIGAAVGGAVPVPAGIGSTEAALVGTLVLAHVSIGSAVAAVLLFRLVTFWAPVPLGLLATPRLRRAGAL